MRQPSELSAGKGFPPHRNNVLQNVLQYVNLLRKLEGNQGKLPFKLGKGAGND